MDVQTLELSMPIPDRREAQRTRRATGRATIRPPRGEGTTAAASRQSWLYAYTTTSIVAGLGALLWTTLAVPIQPSIDPGLEGTALGGPDGGLLLWIAFGLIGSLRVLPVPGGSGVWTFHFPFIAAAMVLGGPTAGAWVGFLATLERREVVSQPWYGALANHSVTALAAVAGGLAVEVGRGALSAAGAEPGVAGLVATALGTIVLAAVANALAAGTIMLREGLPPAGIIEILIRSFGTMTMAEIGLAWVFVTLYLSTGWWAPLVVAVAGLLVWPREGDEFPDPLMKLPRLRQFERELDGVLARTRRGLATGGLLLAIDLDGFGAVNKSLGQDVGDEVLGEIGERLRGLVRSTDLACRRGGDELAMFYASVIDLATARRLAARVGAAIRRPIATSRGTVRVGASIGAVMVRPAAEIPGRATLMRWADLTMQAQKTARKEGRARAGIRFHPYGRPVHGRAGDADDTGDAELEGVAPVGVPRTKGLALRAVVAAGAGFVVVLAAIIARLFG